MYVGSKVAYCTLGLCRSFAHGLSYRDMIYQGACSGTRIVRDMLTSLSMLVRRKSTPSHAGAPGSGKPWPSWSRSMQTEWGEWAKHIHGMQMEVYIHILMYSARYEN